MTKYLIMTDAEFEAALDARANWQDAHPMRREELLYYERLFKDAEAACRAREVPEWATHFARQLPPSDTHHSVFLRRIPK